MFRTVDDIQFLNFSEEQARQVFKDFYQKKEHHGNLAVFSVIRIFFPGDTWKLITTALGGCGAAFPRGDFIESRLRFICGECTVLYSLFKKRSVVAQKFKVCQDYLICHYRQVSGFYASQKVEVMRKNGIRKKVLETCYEKRHVMNMPMTEKTCDERIRD